MDDKLIAGRLEEINESLCAQSGGLIETHFRKSKRIGAAVRIANLIKGQDVIESYEFLLAAAGELRISADTLEEALCDQEERDTLLIQRWVGEIAKKVQDSSCISQSTSTRFLSKTRFWS